MATKINTSVSTATYDDVIVKPKPRGKADLVINHEYAGEMAKMHKKNFKKYGDSIISYKPDDEDEFCSFKIRKIKSKVSSDQMIIKGKRVTVEICRCHLVRPLFPSPGVTIPSARLKRLQEDMKIYSPWLTTKLSSTITSKS